ncbi:MAG: hypothetical protein F6K09_25630 [Merismopedia sp. SIO2A8]|nr:hypothetical protein [Symploca sp. SIO2B6]NET51955.1 hypothetical protein [Merismopedia sp. SIO2A8]
MTRYVNNEATSISTVLAYDTLRQSRIYRLNIAHLDIASQYTSEFT